MASYSIGMCFVLLGYKQVIIIFMVRSEARKCSKQTLQLAFRGWLAPLDRAIHSFGRIIGGGMTIS